MSWNVAAIKNNPIEYWIQYWIQYFEDSYDCFMHVHPGTEHGRVHLRVLAGPLKHLTRSAICKAGMYKPEYSDRVLSLAGLGSS